MAEQQMTQIGGSAASDLYALGYTEIAAARERLGSIKVNEFEERRRAVAAAGRVSRACALARARRFA
jgi:hypothetical protein